MQAPVGSNESSASLCRSLVPARFFKPCAWTPQFDCVVHSPCRSNSRTDRITDRNRIADERLRAADSDPPPRGAFRFIVSQRLVPRADGCGRVAAIEILRSTARTRDYIEKGEREGKSLYDAMRDGNLEGMQVFDGELERMIREGTITINEGLAYATNRQNLLLQLSDTGGGSVEEMMGPETRTSNLVA